MQNMNDLKNINVIQKKNPILISIKNLCFYLDENNPLALEPKQ